MSIIENNGIKRGDLLKSADFNAEFTAVNSAFTMDGDNVRSEGLDQPAFDTNANSGQSGIILKDANKYDLHTGSTITINANTNADSATPQAATEIGNQNTLIVASDTDILRVYWQYDFDTKGNNSTNPYSSSLNYWVWAFWLEWKTSSSGSYSPVPGQGELETAITVSSATKYGDLTSNLRACSLETHAINYFNSVTTNHIVIYPGRRSGYGQWYYQFPSNTTIYGLRIMARGLYEPIYATTSNAVKTLEATGTTHQLEVYELELTYLLMRKQ